MPSPVNLFQVPMLRVFRGLGVESSNLPNEIVSNCPLNRYLYTHRLVQLS